MGTNMTINFNKNGELIREVIMLDSNLSNLAVGQVMAFDYPVLDQCLSGIITNIQHVVFLSGAPLTYIDVEIQ